MILFILLYKLFFLHLCYGKLGNRGIGTRGKEILLLSRTSKYLSSFAYEAHVRLSKKNNQKQQNFKWATSIWVSTGIWESLPITEQQTFFFVCLREPYVNLLCAWWKRKFLMIFDLVFFMIFKHANAWISMCSLVIIRNTWIILLNKITVLINQITSE